MKTSELIGHQYSPSQILLSQNPQNSSSEHWHKVSCETDHIVRVSARCNTQYGCQPEVASVSLALILIGCNVENETKHCKHGYFKTKCFTNLVEMDNWQLISPPDHECYSPRLHFACLLQGNRGEKPDIGWSDTILW